MFEIAFDKVEKSGREGFEEYTSVMTVVEFCSMADENQYILHPNELSQRIFDIL